LTVRYRIALIGCKPPSRRITMTQTAAAIDFATTEHWLAIVGLITGAVGTIVGLLAIAQAAYFYTQAKNAETEALKALHGIQGQTSTLAEISAQQLKGLTQIVRDQVRAPDKNTAVLLTFFERLNTPQQRGLIEPPIAAARTEGATISGHGIPILVADVDKEALRNIAATLFFAIYFYSAYVNVLIQPALPSEDEYDESDPMHRYVRQVMDLSHHDFKLIAAALDQWSQTDSTFLTSHPMQEFFGEEGKKVSAFVRNARQQFDVKKQAPAT
jgi:hypothetical protein